MNKNLKEIIKILMFLKDMDMKEIKEKCTFSYTALRNFLIYHTTMKIDNLHQIFKALDFDMIKAMSIADNIKDLKSERIQVIKELMQEM